MSVDEQDFKRDLAAFVDALENRDLFDETLYAKLVGYGANKGELDQMVGRVRVFASYDDDNAHVGFPYEDWVERLRR